MLYTEDMKRVIVSGYFNPLHGGHLDMIEAAKTMGDYLIVIVNNDTQQLLKKGKIILDQENRCRLMAALRDVDEVVLSVGEDPFQNASLRLVRERYPDDELVFANGGDRDLASVMPEKPTCDELAIEMRFDAGTGKPDSSTRINQARGVE